MMVLAFFFPTPSSVRLLASRASIAYPGQYTPSACFAAGSTDRASISALVPIMPARRLLEIEPPGPIRYILGAVLMLVGVVLPLTYFMFRSKRTPPPSFKQT
ncbi:unnamed protein product [Closterium sp. NIES-65]|nr:unnamed protein product [Closterium sp. NIES-65]